MGKNYTNENIVWKNIFVINNKKMNEGQKKLNNNIKKIYIFIQNHM